MPSSRPNAIPTIISVVRQLRPQSFLDIGVGFGKWGHLFREYTDIVAAENDPSRYSKKHWQVRIDGIEGFKSYLTPMHNYLYDKIHIGNASQLLPKLGQYDLVFLGDVIEHFDKSAGETLLRNALEHANKAVVILTPKFETNQPELCGNELERHRSLWTAADFRAMRPSVVKTVDGETLLAVLLKPGVAPPDLAPPRVDLTPAMERRKFAAARREVERHIPAGQTILVPGDTWWSEQLKLGGRRKLLPFPQRGEKFWGEPADDAAAIAELDKARRNARYIAFGWPTIWWLDYYKGFQGHLRKVGREIWSSPNVILYELGAAARKTS